jgi:hypothetical protein
MKKSMKIGGKTMIELYGPINPEAIINSQYGAITEREWIIREHERISSQPGRVAVIVEGCLFVNQIAG